MDIMTLQEVAEYLKIAPKTVTRMIGRNEIPCMKIAGQWRFKKSVIDQWLGSKMNYSEEHAFASIMDVPATTLQLSRLITPEYMVMNLTSRGVEDTLVQLTHPLIEHGFMENSAQLVTKLLAREQMVTTAVGSGTAFPHLRNVRENQPGLPPIIMGIHHEGVAYGCLDGSLTYVFYLLLASKETTHLRLLSRLAQFSRKPGITEKITAAYSPEEISRLLMEDDYESMAQSLS